MTPRTRGPPAVHPAVSRIILGDDKVAVDVPSSFPRAGDTRGQPMFVSPEARCGWPGPP